MNPTQANERIKILDVMRGFALFGIIFVNIPALSSVTTPTTTIEHQYYYFLQIFVEGKFFTIFSFLFGVGLFIFTERTLKEHGLNLLAKRLAILLVFGIIHMYFHPGEALTVYAIYGFMLMIAFKLPRFVNLIIGFSLLALFTYSMVKVFMPFPIILLGIAAGQYGLFKNVCVHYKKWILFTIVMGIVSSTIVYYQYRNLPPLTLFNGINRENELYRHRQLLEIGAMSGPFISAFYVGILVVLNEMKIFRLILRPLEKYGRMAFTNYLMQTALILFINSLLSTTTTFATLGCIALLINISLIIFSMVWLKYFKYGPLEKIWRFGTYFKTKTIAKKTESY